MQLNVKFITGTGTHPGHSLMLTMRFRWFRPVAKIVQNIGGQTRGPGCLSVSTDKSGVMRGVIWPDLFNGTDMTDMSNYTVRGGNAESNRKGLLLATAILMSDKTGTNQRDATLLLLFSPDLLTTTS